jgi:hypothetical protein
MHYTILVLSCTYICFDTSCAIIRGVVESSQFSKTSNSLSLSHVIFSDSELCVVKVSWMY